MKSIRPGYGLAPKYLEKVIGSSSTRDIEPGSPVTFEDFIGV